MRAIICACLLWASDNPEVGLPRRADGLGAAVWDDGKAEVGTYRSRRTIYGRPRDFATTLIVVKEDFGTVSRVKVDRADPNDPAVPGVKLNIVQRIPTENYPYSYLITVLVERSDPFRLLKASVSSQEWCGTTFQQLGHVGGSWKYWWDSYWQGEGHGSRVLASRPVSEEQLFLALRDVAWREGLDVTVPIVWGMHANRARASEPVPTRIRYRARKTIAVPAGRFETFEIEVTAPSQEARYFISTAPPYYLVRYEGSEGRELALEKMERRAYWIRGANRGG